MANPESLIFEASESGDLGDAAGVVLNLDARTLDHGIRWFFAGRVEQLRLAALDTAHRGVAYAVRLSKREGLTYLGGYIAAFAAHKTPDGAIFLNDAPYAHVIEYGRRPGRPGPPIEPIVAWCLWKFGDDKMAFAVRKKIHEEGTPPHFIVQRTNSQMELWYRLEVKRRLGLR